MRTGTTPYHSRRSWESSARPSLLMLAAAFFAGAFLAITLDGGRHVAGVACGETVRASPDERGPPTKEELGNAGWTLLHTLAANFADAPTPRQQQRADVFFRALGDLYPCPTCAGHLREYMEAHPVESATRTALSLWVCRAHNDVRRRQRKEAFYCDMGVLDARWKDCGCNSTAAAPLSGRGVGRGRMAKVLGLASR